jgi:integrase/recombinase XerD
MRKKRLTLAIRQYVYEQSKELNLRPATIKNRRNSLQRLKDFLQEKPFSLKTTKAYLKHLREAGRTPAGINFEIKQLRAFSTFLFRRCLIEKNFGKDLVPMKVPKKIFNLISPELAEEVITAGCELTSFDNTPEKRKIKKDMKCALRFLLRTGLRVSELCRLRGTDFRLDDEQPHFTVISKGGSEAVLPMPPDMINELRPRLQAERVFQVTPAGLNKALARGAKKLGIKKRVHCHLLRHIFATSRLRAGIAPQVVQRLLRHSSFEITNSTYLHYDLGDLARAINTQDIVREAMSPPEVFDELEKALKAVGIEKDRRFRLSVRRNAKNFTLSIDLVT